jgi:hypothetical protein
MLERAEEGLVLNSLGTRRAQLPDVVNGVPNDRKDYPDKLLFELASRQMFMVEAVPFLESCDGHHLPVGVVLADTAHLEGQLLRGRSRRRYLVGATVAAAA